MTIKRYSAFRKAPALLEPHHQIRQIWHTDARDIVLYTNTKIMLAVVSFHIHHHVVPWARISLTLFRHLSLSSIAFTRSFRLYSVSIQNSCALVQARRPTPACPCEGVHRRTSLMSSSSCMSCSSNFNGFRDVKLSTISNIFRVLILLLDSWYLHCSGLLVLSKVGDLSRGWPESFLFNSVVS